MSICKPHEQIKQCCSMYVLVSTNQINKIKQINNPSLCSNNLLIYSLITGRKIILLSLVTYCQLVSELRLPSQRWMCSCYPLITMSKDQKIQMCHHLKCRDESRSCFCLNGLVT